MRTQGQEARKGLSVFGQMLGFHESVFTDDKVIRLTKVTVVAKSGKPHHTSLASQASVTTENTCCGWLRVAESNGVSRKDKQKGLWVTMATSTEELVCGREEEGQLLWPHQEGPCARNALHLNHASHLQSTLLLIILSDLSYEDATDIIRADKELIQKMDREWKIKIWKSSVIILKPNYKVGMVSPHPPSNSLPHQLSYNLTQFWL